MIGLKVIKVYICLKVKCSATYSDSSVKPLNFLFPALKPLCITTAQRFKFSINAIVFSHLVVHSFFVIKLL